MEIPVCVRFVHIERVIYRDVHEMYCNSFDNSSAAGETNLALT
jgi:hypothetical protein